MFKFSQNFLADHHCKTICGLRILSLGCVCITESYGYISHPEGQDPKLHSDATQQSEGHSPGPRAAIWASLHGTSAQEPADTWNNRGLRFKIQEKKGKKMMKFYKIFKFDKVFFFQYFQFKLEQDNWYFISFEHNWNWRFKNTTKLSSQCFKICNTIGYKIALI